MNSIKIILCLLIAVVIFLSNVSSIPVNNNTTFVSELSARSVCTMTKTKCYALVMTCLNYRCEFDTKCKNFCCEKSCGSWYVCGACFGFSFR
ncbi:hypothetical protein I4U23_014484 [Adineta vaga]|nr:hypothetical protein I4U23_014484 [Adineta vaga]